MKARAIVVRTWHIEELSQGELEIILEWARIARVADRGWSQDEQLLAEELKSMYSVIEEEEVEIQEEVTGKRMVLGTRPSLRRGGMGEKSESTEREGMDERVDMAKDGVVDTGEGMIWKERD